MIKRPAQVNISIVLQILLLIIYSVSLYVIVKSGSDWGSIFVIVIAANISVVTNWYILLKQANWARVTYGLSSLAGVVLFLPYISGFFNLLLKDKYFGIGILTGPSSSSNASPADGWTFYGGANTLDPEHVLLVANIVFLMLIIITVVLTITYFTSHRVKSWYQASAARL